MLAGGMSKKYAFCTYHYYNAGQGRLLSQPTLF